MLEVILIGLAKACCCCGLGSFVAAIAKGRCWSTIRGAAECIGRLDLKHMFAVSEIIGGVQSVTTN